jgi:uncharacterized protein (TIGR02246 family)
MKDEEAIKRLIGEWHRATNAGEVDAVLPLMAEDVTFLVPGQPPMKGRRAFEEGLRTLLASHHIESTGEVQEIVVSGDLAYCWTVLTVRITPRSGGSAQARSGSALSVLRRQPDGSWVVVRDANLLTPRS